jgi:hypothetical protein
MDKITFIEIGVNNIDKYIGKECIVDEKKFIIIGYNTNQLLFILVAVNPKDGRWNDDNAYEDFSVFDRTDVVLKKMPKGTTYSYSYYVFI